MRKNLVTLKGKKEGLFIHIKDGDFELIKKHLSINLNITGLPLLLFLEKLHVLSLLMLANPPFMPPRFPIFPSVYEVHATKSGNRFHNSAVPHRSSHDN